MIDILNIKNISNIPLNSLILGDCLEVMKLIPAKSIDLALTDPPYELNIAKRNTLLIFSELF